MKYTLLIIALAVLTSPGCNEGKSRNANATPAATDSATAERDNTGVNVRDRSDAAKTPIDQNENQKDIDITANIRKRVVDTKMSVNAQNVKIITQSGKVTLRGPVKSEEEKAQIAKMADEVAGPEMSTTSWKFNPNLLSYVSRINIMAKAVFCIVNASQAASVVDRLKAAAFSNSDISVLMPDRSGTKDFAVDNSTKAPEGAATGAGTGAVAGGGLGWLAGIGALAIPGLRTFDRCWTDHGCTHRRRSRWYGWRPHGCVGRHGNPRIRSQAVRG